MSVNGAVKVRSSFLAVSKLICYSWSASIMLSEKFANLQHIWIGDYCLEFDRVDEWFSQCNVLDTGVVESIDIVPN